jgi:hypothetical protein
MKAKSLRRRWVSMFGLCALHCAVDQRDLQLAGQAGATEVGSGGDGSAGERHEAGSNGGSPVQPDSPPLVDGCADLDTDGVSDCSVTLVDNATFESGVTGWKALDTASLTWNDRNALGDEPSGCALLRGSGIVDSDGSTLLSATQCVAVPAGKIIIAYANVRVSAASGMGQAQVEVSFFSGDDCEGEPISYFSTPPSTAADTWVTIQAGGVSGAATKSALVALVGIKPNRAAALEACFDNVMVSDRPL